MTKSDQNKKKAIYFITKGNRDFPSSRFRAFQYEPLLRNDGYSIQIEKAHKNLLVRIVRFFKFRNYDILFVQKRFLYWIEMLFVRWLFETIVYDFDDSMGLASNYKTEDSGKLRRKNKRLLRMCRVADIVICCNSSLQKLSGRPDALLLPTPYSPPEKPSTEKEFEQINLLWIGMDLTKLKPWEDSLQKLCHDSGILITLSSHKTSPPSLLFPFKYEPWSREVESSLLSRCNVGIMPLPDDLNSPGKCGFKIIQYMAHGLIAVASDIGFNQEIIDDGVDGFLCKDQDHFATVMADIIEGRYDLSAIRKAGLKKSAHYRTENTYRTLKQYLRLD